VPPGQQVRKGSGRMKIIHVNEEESFRHFDWKNHYRYFKTESSTSKNIQRYLAAALALIVVSSYLFPVLVLVRVVIEKIITVKE